jgi:hypothetical protein
MLAHISSRLRLVIIVHVIEHGFDCSRQAVIVVIVYHIPGMLVLGTQGCDVLQNRCLVIGIILTEIYLCPDRFA